MNKQNILKEISNKLQINNTPDLAIILGSGINLNFPDCQIIAQINYADISGFPAIGVSGHKGLIQHLKVNNQNILAFAGRFHLYEAYSIEQVQTIVNLIYAFKIPNLLITNAAGGLSDQLLVGDLMLIEQISNFQVFSSGSPLDNLQDNNLQINTALNERIIKTNSTIKRGNYAAVLGPNYETDAEIQLFKKLNCSAVGMSTYLEAKFAIENKMNFSAISVITNSWSASEIPSHEEVLANSKANSQKLSDLILKISPL